MNKVFIIAEAGINHNGSVTRAKEMISVAFKAGADAVKFQTFRSEKVISKYAPKAEYQKVTTGINESQLDMAKKLELQTTDFEKLADYCNEIGIIFLSTPFDFESLDFLEKLGVDTIKIPSGEVTNLPYLRRVGSLGKKLILSTGMSDLEEIGKALDILMNAGTKKDNITVLHCCSEYPAPYESINISAMLTIRDAFRVNVGLSDHSLGIEVPIAAVAMGATIIEKHFTLDKSLPGPDHPASLSPAELSSMVRAIRHIEMALGDGSKQPTSGEKINKSIVRRSIVASQVIKKGAIFTLNNITAKRPGTGISPMLWDEVLGKTASRNFDPDELIEL